MFIASTIWFLVNTVYLIKTTKKKTNSNLSFADMYVIYNQDKINNTIKKKITIRNSKSFKHLFKL